MYRIVMEIDRGAGLVGAARYAFRNAEPSPTIDEVRPCPDDRRNPDRDAHLGDCPVQPAAGCLVGVMRDGDEP